MGKQKVLLTGEFLHSPVYHKLVFREDEESVMEWYPRLYIGESINHPDKLIHKLKKHNKFLDAYVLILSRNPSDQLEIHKAGYLAQKYYRKNPPYVIGIAGSYDEAVALVIKIAEEAYAAQGNCRLKEYLKCYM